MIDIRQYEIFNKHQTTMKKTSQNSDGNKETYMTESILPVINFDKVKNDYSAQLKINAPRSVDALYISDAGLTLIEFKNSKVERHDVSLKMVDSLWIILDTIGEEPIYARENIDYIIVYSENKNHEATLDETYRTDQKTYIQESESRDYIGKVISRKAGEPIIQFGLERFKKMYLRNIRTYTEKEFEKYFIATN